MTSVEALNEDLEQLNGERLLIPGGIVSSAKAITNAPSEEERHTLRNVVVLTLAAVLAVKGLDWLRQSRGWEDHGRFDQQAFDRQISRTFEDAMRRPLVPLLSRMFLLGRSTLAGGPITLAENEAKYRLAERWASAYAAKAAQDYAATSAAVYLPNVREWLQRPLPAAAMALRGRELYGLDPRSANAILGYSSNKSSRFLHVGGLTEKYLEKRALANATVFAMTSMNAGREFGYIEAMSQGLISPSAKKIWITAHDERVCPSCGPMEGVTATFGGTYSVHGRRLFVPPVHPSCRCTIAVDEELAAPSKRRFPADPTKVSSWLAASGELFR